jgi:2-C-methyl-D-erythritol 4-phosphate cytidylyltransferase
MNGIYAILLAGGSGNRFDSEGSIPKQFFRLAGQEVLIRTVTTFLSIKEFDQIVIVLPNVELPLEVKATLDTFGERISLIKGGLTRNESSYLALSYIKKFNPSKVIIHDAVRPLVSRKLLLETLVALEDSDAVDTYIPISDTLIVSKDKNYLDNFADRNTILRGQTPQGFQYETIAKAYSIAKEKNDLDNTCDCSLLKKNLPNTKIKLIRGEESNIKITHKTDITLAESYISKMQDSLFQSPREVYEERRYEQIALKESRIYILGKSGYIGSRIHEELKLMSLDVVGFSRDIGELSRHNLQIKFRDELIKTPQKSLHVINCMGIVSSDEKLSSNIDKVDNLIEVNYRAVIETVSALITLKDEFPQTRISLVHMSSSIVDSSRDDQALYGSSKVAADYFLRAIYPQIKHLMDIHIVSPSRLVNSTVRREINASESVIANVTDEQLVTGIVRALLENSGFSYRRIR